MTAELKTPWNPSRSATARVRDAFPVPEVCPYCKGHVSIQHHESVYNGRTFGDWPWMYVCDDCEARVGMHPFTALPLGTLADQATRHARMVCKPHFEALWKLHGIDRSTAYARLAERLGISVKQCHFGLFDVATCEKARAICMDRSAFETTP